MPYYRFREVWRALRVVLEKRAEARKKALKGVKPIRIKKR